MTVANTFTKDQRSVITTGLLQEANKSLRFEIYPYKYYIYSRGEGSVFWLITNTQSDTLIK